MCINNLAKSALYLLFPVVVFLAFVQPLRGLSSLVMGSEKGDALDLQLRWTEEQYFLRGINPLDVWARHSARAIENGVAVQSTRPSDVESDLDLPDPAHPPWGYVTGIAYLWPSWPTVRFYYAALSVLIIAGLTFGMFKATRPLGLPMAFLLALGVPAMQGVCLTLQLGQYGILVTGLLAGCLALLGRGKEIPAGLLLGLALVKPTIAAPFFLVLLCRRHFIACGATVMYCAAASLVAWAALGTTPLELLRQLHACGSTYPDVGTFGELFIAAGLDRASALLATAAIGVALLVMALIFRSERLSLADAFALAAVVGRLWTYHQEYDNIMLIFLIVPLAYRARRSEWPIPAALALFLVCLSLWLPSRFVAPASVQLLLAGIWMGAAAVVVFQPAPAQEVPLRQVSAGEGDGAL